MLNKICKVCLLAAVVAVSGYFTGLKAQSVSGSIRGGSVTRGSAGRASVTLSIPAGLHVNSHRPNGEYMIATTVTARSNGAKIGAVSYPRGRNRKFGFSESLLNVYEGRVTFGFNVTVPSTYRGRTVTVNVSVKYQACTNEVCYSPKTKQLTLTAKVN